MPDSTTANETPLTPPVQKGLPPMTAGVKGVDDGSSGANYPLSGGYVPKECYDNSSLQSNFHDSAVLPPAERERKSSAAITLVPLLEVPSEANVLDHDVNLLHVAHHADPFSILGPHSFTHNGTAGLVIRGWVKDAQTMAVRVLSESDFKIEGAEENEGWVEMAPRCAWLFQCAFECRISSSVSSGTSDVLSVARPLYELRVTYAGDASGTKYVVRDTYSFPCMLRSGDLQLFQSGSCWHVDNLMGSHCVRSEGADGVRFAVWAPNAKYVSVVADFNQWDGRAHPMRKRHEFGVWELFVPTVARPGQKYGYRIHSRAENDFVKIDPYAQEFENPPATASVISGCDDAYKKDEDRYQWNDEEWMAARMADAEKIHRKPMSIYEVHLPSWMRGDGNSYLGYRELAPRLVEHLELMNFTHVEFLPLAHHPFEGSWGYQVSGLYAPYSRLGNADDLKYLVDYLHQHGFGVFVDFVPAHFVKDTWGLVYYDGEPCFEYADPREGEHRTWGTMVFNFRRNEVRSFLLGAAYHWLRRYHLDGLRIDAVSSMLYKNYCRDEGDWLPNEFGGDANLEAINMLQELNWVIHKEFPGVFTMAEEATSWKGVTDKKEGLGFDAKWDLGWMNDTLSYLCTPCPLRPEKHSKLTFRGLYAADERWVLPLSHDEVVSGKGSLLDKCGFAGATFEERLSTMKSLFTYQIGLGGRPLIFMGQEFAQGREWKESHSVDWHESAEDKRGKFMRYVSDLLYLYKTEKALHAGDDDCWNFKWSECDNPQSCVIAWLRNWMEWNNDILVVCNFSPNIHYRFPIGVPHGGEWEVLLNSDDWKYGGTMKGPGNGGKVHTTQGGRLGWPYCLWFDLPPWGSVVLKAPQPRALGHAEIEKVVSLGTAAALPSADAPAGSAATVGNLTPAPAQTIVFHSEDTMSGTVQQLAPQAQSQVQGPVRALSSTGPSTTAIPAEPDVKDEPSRGEETPAPPASPEAVSG
eukprot:Gregarina_sp_Poly_1__7285@NODE_3_length_27868_cov_154_961188_g2_i0_p2_GENE_NODE_3_length_27868_cov_154_961188_g2_i0NODE_3_length_27868_cov_154_961188_g2_i0_p2_ORF_typecomplete_len976_score148_14Alphaamylase/PF00128_24/1_7e31CBM_48/PF02922_18/5_4e03CBM_48/PF02922_18/2_5e26CBM_48/PF02922_18/1_6e03Alphaamylase_C/PF02806_18/6_2e20Melibiase/PF02065_18/0_00012AMPK1_CBM/PF16561_5/0_0012GHL10/PF02638_15/0_019Glyco_hydro_70/PF02324_16/2_1Glyco_hydro_70/PF02324_16/69_NODE_3_length_27868_cov_154_961188_g2_